MRFNHPVKINSQSQNVKRRHVFAWFVQEPPVQPLGMRNMSVCSIRWWGQAGSLFAVRIIGPWKLEGNLLIRSTNVLLFYGKHIKLLGACATHWRKRLSGGSKTLERKLEGINTNKTVNNGTARPITLFLLRQFPIHAGTWRWDMRDYGSFPIKTRSLISRFLSREVLLYYKILLNHA